MAISFAMECYERGLITSEHTGGVELRFGQDEAMLCMIHKIGRREDLGDLLAMGTRYASKEIGRGTEAYAMHVKGLELAGYDPRGAKGMGLGYATSPRGGCHERGYLIGEVLGGDPSVDRFSCNGKGAMVVHTQDIIAVKDSLGFCVLSSAGTSLEGLAELFTSVTGIPMDEKSLVQAGERICNLERLFNLREGFTRADDSLPKRLCEERVRGSDGNMHRVELDHLIDQYYSARGWDDQGVPKLDTLVRLNLDKVLEERFFID